MNERYARQVLSGQRRTLPARLIVAALAPLSLLCGLVTRIRRRLYRKGVLGVRRLDRPVISIGNITAGGTGKTPMVALVARWYLERGRRVAVLSRGYGGSGDGGARIVSDGASVFLPATEAGDEPVLLAQMMPGLMVVTGRDRFEAGLLAQKRLHPDIFILDDGFQHRRLYRDLDIVLLDAQRPFGNGFVLPAGLMREPVSSLEDADVVVFTRSEEDPASRNFLGKPVLHARHRLMGMRVVTNGGHDSKILPFALLDGRSGVAVAGIAEPESFFSMLEATGVGLCGRVAFADHAAYKDGEVAEIHAAVRAAEASFVITTEKDAVKLGRLAEYCGVPVYAAVLELDVRDWSEFERLLLPAGSD